MSAMPVSAPLPQATLNQCCVGTSNPRVWPSYGSVTTFDWSNTTAYPPGTALESITGWSLLSGGYAGAMYVGTNALSVVAHGTDSAYIYNTGYRAQWIEVTMPAESNYSFQGCCRIVDTNNFLGMRITGGALIVYQRISGTFTTLMTINGGGAGDLNGIYRLEVRDDDTWHVYYAGSEIKSFTTTGANNGQGLEIASGTVPAVLSASTYVGFVTHGDTAQSNIIGKTRFYGGIIEHGLNRGAQCWFHGPRAENIPAAVVDAARVAASLPAQGKSYTFIGVNCETGVGSASGSAQLTQICNESGAVVGTYGFETDGNYDDDHTYPVCVFRPDGRIVVFRSFHRSTAGLVINISVNPYDVLGGFSADQIVLAPQGTYAALNGAWTATTAYTLGQSVTAGGQVFLCVQAGTSGSTGPTGQSSRGISDGTVKWDYQSTGDNFTYPSPVMLSAESNKIYVFFRGLNSGTGLSYATFASLSTTTAPASNGAAAGTITPDNVLSFTATISGHIMTVSAITAGQIGNGSLISGAGVTAGTYVLGFISGTGGIGTYYVSASQTVSTGTVMTAQASVIVCNGGTQGVYHRVWSDRQARIDFFCTDAIAGGSGTKTDVRHFYYQGGTIRQSGGQPIQGGPWGLASSLTISGLTAIATSGAPDGYGDIWIHDGYRNPTTGYIYAVFARFISTTDHQYYYAVCKRGVWTKTLISGTDSGPITSVGQETYYSPGVFMDHMADGVVYAAVGANPTLYVPSSSVYRLITIDEGVSFTWQKISRPAWAAGEFTNGSVGQSIRPLVPYNRDPRNAVLWFDSVGPFGYQYYSNAIGVAGIGPAYVNAGYATEIMTAKF